jgi:hypothetical protein
MSADSNHVYPLYYNFRFNGTTAMLMHADDVEAADRLKEWRQDSSNKDLSVAGDDRSPPWTWRTYLYAGTIDDVNQIVMPQENIMAALRYAGSQLTLKGAKTFKKLAVSAMSVQSEFCQLKVGLGHADAAPVIDEIYVREVLNNPEPTKEDVVKAAAALGVRPGDRHPGYGLRIIKAADIESIHPMTKFREQVMAARRLGFNLYAKRAPIGQAKHVRVRPRFEVWEVSGQLKITHDAIDDAILQKMVKIAGEQSGLGDWRPSSPKSPGPFGQFKAELTFLGDSETYDPLRKTV